MEPWYKRAGDYMLDAFTDIDTSFKGARADAREWASPVTDWMRDADSELMDGIRHYLGPHAGPPVQAALKYGPEMFGPGADVRDMTEGSSQFAQALMNRDYSGALEGGALMAGGTLMAALPGPSVSSMKRGADEVVDALPMDEASKGLTLYHGSPHDFDTFSMDHIGSGEGAQDLGRGLYFFDDEAEATLYRNPASRWGDTAAMEKYAAIGPGRTYETGINAAEKDFLDVNAPASILKPGSRLAARRDEIIAAETDPAYRDVMQKHMRVSNVIQGREDDVLADGFAGVMRERGSGGKEFALYDPQRANILNKYGDGLAMQHSGDIADALPMDEASRMARAEGMGFDTSKTLYHGTPDVRGIDADGFSTASERLMGDDRSGPYYFTNRKQTAATYADDTRAFDYQNAEPEIIEAFVAQANPLVIDAKGSSFREGIDLSELREQMPDYSDLNELRMGFDSATGRMMVHSDQMSDLAKLNGYDGVVIRNIRDEYNGGGMPSDVYMVFNPSKIRRTTAKFDPAKRDSRDLTAGLAMPVAAGSALALALQGYRNEQGDDGTPIYRREQ